MFKLNIISNNNEINLKSRNNYRDIYMHLVFDSYFIPRLKKKNILLMSISNLI